MVICWLLRITTERERGKYLQRVSVCVREREREREREVVSERGSE